MVQEFMQFPQIDPIIFQIGPIALRWYGLMYLLGFVGALWLGNMRADRPNSGWTRDQVSDLLFYGFIGVILGGRIGYVIFYHFDYFLANPLYLFKVWEGGMSFHGGLLGVIMALIIFARITNKKMLELGDFVAPLVPLGLGFGRIGNFINGELWGRTSDVPWAMVFPGGGPLARHPSQLYQAALEGFCLFLVLYLFSRKPRPLGVISGMFLLGYGLCRFIVEFFREPDAHLGLLTLNLSMGQLLTIPMLVGGLFLIINGYAKHKSQPQHS
ncbi:MAG: prolipoprotein diacylglyceryl transferase [Gammaproteobacteria bacterium]|nr:prolipoprotein diacylglyceryl transferase [Gammaproteobacteria bacterium]